MTSQFFSQNQGNPKKKKKGLHLKPIYNLSIFLQNHGYFALGSQNINPKIGKKPNKIFDASRASLHSTPLYLL